MAVPVGSAGRTESAGPGAAGAPRADAIPPRPPDAITGSEFARRTAGLPVREWQRVALREIRRGNIPGFLRSLKPVRLGAPGPGGAGVAVIWVMPDYLAIGSDEDFLRVPLTLPAAAAVAREFGFVLPTTKMVDAIHEQSVLRLAPQPLPAGPAMRSSDYCLRHQRVIERQRAGRAEGELVSGHKKDVVLTNRLRLRPGRVAIYGWHRADGTTIQPLSTYHGERYVDYSHGVRLVAASVWVDGVERPIVEVLEDPVLAPLLSSEGEMPDVASLLRGVP